MELLAIRGALIVPAVSKFEDTKDSRQSLLAVKNAQRTRGCVLPCNGKKRKTSEDNGCQVACATASPEITIRMGLCRAKGSAPELQACATFVLDKLGLVVV